MTKDIVKLANESGLLKRMNAKIKTKEKNIEENKKRYWKLSASERLHYDSRIKKIQKDNSILPGEITIKIAKVYFYFLVVFVLFKVLFQVDPVHMINPFLSVIGTAPMIFGVSIFLDIFFIIVEIRSRHKSRIYLNEKYGFKKV